LPALDLADHVDLIHLVRGLVNDGLLQGIHDVSEGGLGLALAEMAVASGVGFTAFGVEGHAELFGESPSRVVACVSPDRLDEVTARAAAAGVPCTDLGHAGGSRLVVEGLVDVTVEAARAAARDALPNALSPA
jgi:phosphoribosylformylglycinamidine synthase